MAEPDTDRAAHPDGWWSAKLASTPQHAPPAALPDDVGKEYYHLQSIVDGYNANCITIKSWSVTAASVTIAGAIAAKSNEIFLVTLGTAIAFWLTEGYWRANQWAFVQRIREIESRRYGWSPLISHGWAQYWATQRRFPELRAQVLQPRCSLPHGPIAALALLLWVFGVAS